MIQTTLFLTKFERRVEDDVSVPTWTGRSGMAGAPAVVREGSGLGSMNKNRFGSVKNSGLLKEAQISEQGWVGGRIGGGGGQALVSESDKRFGGAATCGVFGLGVAPTGSGDLLKKLQERNLEAGDSDALRRSEEQEEDESWALLMMQDLRSFLQQKQPTTQVKIIGETIIGDQ